MNLTVLGSRVFIKPDKLPETSTGGLHLVHDRRSETMTGTVVAVGDGPEFAQMVHDDTIALVAQRLERLGFQHVRVPIQQTQREYQHEVMPGDRVLFSPIAGEELIFEKDVFVVMREDEILAVIEQENV